MTRTFAEIAFTPVDSGTPAMHGSSAAPSVRKFFPPLGCPMFGTRGIELANRRHAGEVE